MSKMSLIYMISKEMKRLNDKIDQKIVKGESYEREARQHKALLSQMNRIEREAAFSRSFALMSAFF